MTLADIGEEPAGGAALPGMRLASDLLMDSDSRSSTLDHCLALGIEGELLYRSAGNISDAIGTRIVDGWCTPRAWAGS